MCIRDSYGPDPLRYFICAAGPESQDADFTWAEFIQRNNSELVAGWGNLVNRTASMIHKRFGEIPAAGPLEPIDEELLSAIRGRFDTVGALIERQRLQAGHGQGMPPGGVANASVPATADFQHEGGDQPQAPRTATPRAPPRGGT